MLLIIVGKYHLKSKSQSNSNIEIKKAFRIIKKQYKQNCF